MRTFSKGRCGSAGRCLGLGALLVATLQLGHGLDQPERIFNGRDLSGWTVEPEAMAACWTVQDGVLHLQNDDAMTGSILWTTREYADFLLECEFRLGEETVDTGIFLRHPREQIQIGQSGSLKRDMTGSPYIDGVGYPVEADGVGDLLKTDGWNRLSIRAVGPTYTVLLDGVEVLDYESPTAEERGPIGIQLHSKRVMTAAFRNIRLTAINPPDPAMKHSLNINGRHFVDSTGKPFFWLADTAWNGALKATEAEWARYLDTRAGQGFNVIQFVLNRWRGADRPLHGRIFDLVDGRIVADDAALEAMDRYLQAVVDRGMVPAPVMFWTNNPAPYQQKEDWMQRDITNPYFDEESMIEIGRRMVARWEHLHPVWILAGDGDYRGREFADLWRRVGRAVFAGHPDALVTTHPCGATWVGDLYRDEPWFKIVGIQSGHGTSEHDLRMLTQGPWSTRWQEIHKPFVNLEPNYEGAVSYHSGEPHTPFNVRRAAWWSLLGAPTAGITYGTNSIWAWLRGEDESAEGHGNGWKGGPWTNWLESEGIRQMTLLKAIFEELPWTDLRPADHLVDDQPGYKDAEAFIKAAALEDGSLILAYKPLGERISLQLPDPHRISAGEWIDPRNGDRQPARAEPGDRLVYRSPDDRDWLLVLR